MEYAPHGNLSAYLNGQVRPLGWREKRRLCIDVARGLEYLHARKPQPLVHGDLKVSFLLM
jgi:serine/threonine protein kinase